MKKEECDIDVIRVDCRRSNIVQMINQEAFGIMSIVTDTCCILYNNTISCPS